MRLPQCLCVLAAALVVPACAGRPSLPDAPAQPETVRVEVAEAGVLRLRDVPLEEYVAATALSELAPAAGDARVVEAMYEVQAVIARTYAVSHRGRHAAAGFDLCATTHCQLYEPGRLSTSRWASTVREAVARTAGELLMFGGAPAEALYHSDCGGHTSAASDVWGGSGYRYLLSRPDGDAAEAAHTSWKYAVDEDTLVRALRSDPRTSVRGRLKGIRVAVRDSAGRAQTVVLQGDSDVTVRGVDLREVLDGRFGARSIRSTLFDVISANHRVEFTGRGFGHGVGLCQAGAFARLAAGAQLRDVLEHYYPGTKVLVSPALRPSSRTRPG